MNVICDEDDAGGRVRMADEEEVEHHLCKINYCLSIGAMTDNCTGAWRAFSMMAELLDN